MRTMDKETYEKSVKQQIREGKTVLLCSGCGEEFSLSDEDHHIFGRNNADDTTPLCLNCHRKISVEQNKVNPQSRSAFASIREKRGFLLVSVGALLELIGKHLKN